MTGQLFLPPRPTVLATSAGKVLHWRAIKSIGADRCATRALGLERVWRCLLLERCPRRCGDDCLPVRAARSKCWCASAATEDGATAEVNAADRRAAKRSTPLASAIRAVARGASRMPGGRGGIASASASSWRSSSHRHRHRQEIVTHQWVPRNPVQAVYWGRSWTWRRLPQVAMNRDGLATGVHEVATAWCDATSRVAAELRATSCLVAAEENRMDSHPDNAAGSAPRAGQ